MSMLSCSRSVALSALILLTSTPALGQESILLYREYAKRTDAAQKVGPLTDAAFGAETSLYNGSTSFRAVDIDLPGIGSVPVQLSRKMEVAKRSMSGSGRLDGMADWEIEVPMLEGTFNAINNWKVGNGSTARCSNTATPQMSNTFVFVPEDVWHGYFMHVPGAGADMLLVNDRSGVVQPVDGAVYPWIAYFGDRDRSFRLIVTGQS